MSDQRPVNLSTSGPPETVLPSEPTRVRDQLDEALARPADEQRDAVAAIVVSRPRYLDGWARLGQLGRDPIERYAAFRVGYHRGLDSLRQNGWRGSGYVRWAHPENRGFLRAVEGLRSAAAEIGETDEEERCAQFLDQLDPDWPPTDL
jgi:hypothetical protein